MYKYNTSAKRFCLWLMLIISSLIFFLPQKTIAAGLVPCGLNSGTVEEMKPCTICHVVVGGKRVIDWGMKIMVVIALTVILAMGILYIVSAGNQSMMQTAKGGLLAALVGFSVMLAAWLIVNVILTILVDQSKEPFAGLVRTSGIFSFSCDTQSNANVK